MTETADAAMQAVRALRTAGVQGGYREAVEALAALEAMSWFNNFGEEIYRERMTAVYFIEAAHPGVYDEYAELVDHARDVVEGTA